MLINALTELLKSFTSGRVKYLSPETKVGLRANTVPVSPKGYPLHSHNYAELVQPIIGHARLNIGGGHLVIKPGSAYLVLPKTIHSENYAEYRKPYLLMWVVFGPGGINFFFSSYSPAKKFTTLPEKIIGQTLNLPPLLDLTSSTDMSERLTDKAKFQALMIQVFLHVLANMDKTTNERPDHQLILVNQTREYLRQHFRENISIQELALMSRCTPNYLNGIFKKITGNPIHQFILSLRLNEARALLEDKKYSVKEVAYKLGFKDPLYFSRFFRKRFGRPPTGFNP